MNHDRVAITVEFGECSNQVTIRMSGHSNPIVADIVGSDIDEHGEVFRVYLRGKIHNSSKSIDYSGWSATGAISTILTRVKAA
jgi:hypothetical protein